MSCQKSQLLKFCIANLRNHQNMNWLNCGSWWKIEKFWNGWRSILIDNTFESLYFKVIIYNKKYRNNGRKSLRAWGQQQPANIKQTIIPWHIPKPHQLTTPCPTTIPTIPTANLSQPATIPPEPAAVPSFSPTTITIDRHYMPIL